MVLTVRAWVTEERRLGMTEERGRWEARAGESEELGCCEVGDAACSACSAVFVSEDEICSAAAERSAGAGLDTADTVAVTAASAVVTVNDGSCPARTATGSCDATVTSIAASRRSAVAGMAMSANPSKEADASCVISWAAARQVLRHLVLFVHCGGASRALSNAAVDVSDNQR